MSQRSGANPRRASGDVPLNAKRASGAKSSAAGSGAAPKKKPAVPTQAAAAASTASTTTTTPASASSASVDAATKGVANLKVEGSPPTEKRRVTGAAGAARRGRKDDDDTASIASTASNSSTSSNQSAASSASSASSSSASSATSLSAAKAQQARRRLSMATGKEQNDVTKLDGHADGEAAKDINKVLKSMAASGGTPAAAASTVTPSSTSPNSTSKGAAAASSSSTTATKQPRRAFSHFASLSKVGYVPFNPNKVNQDRSVEIAKFGGIEDKAFFICADGHGSLGHEVSSYLIQELPKFVLKQTNLDSNPHEAISKAFVDCNVKLASSSIDCTFSGSTCIAVYIANGKIYSCNAGDSRAVLARATPSTGTGESKVTAIALSSDQKPEREDEKKRIIENKGRVEACKGAKGEDIGPPRVWLSHQDVPGLAMSRSFGDLIAASVGVIAKPEIWEREQHEGDKFMILASDGVWEFISNQEAVDLVHAVTQKSGPEEAAKAIVEEATKRWKAEEEVVDDITAVIVYF